MIDFVFICTPIRSTEAVFLMVFETAHSFNLRRKQNQTDKQTTNAQTWIWSNLWLYRIENILTWEFWQRAAMAKASTLLKQWTVSSYCHQCNKNGVKFRNNIRFPGYHFEQCRIISHVIQSEYRARDVWFVLTENSILGQVTVNKHVLYYSLLSRLSFLFVINIVLAPSWWRGKSKAF